MDAAEKLQPIPNAPTEESTPLEDALEAVAQDARRDPRGYLEDTRVPGGGE